MNGPQLLCLGVLAAALAGCTLAPEYRPPPAPVPTAWPDGPAYASSGASAAAADAFEGDWRQVFPDVRLQHLLELALAHNRDLRLAALNVERSRALYGIQRDQLLPTVNAAASASRQQASADLTPAGQPRITERYDVNLGVLAWEIDFFGRLRSLKDRALQEYLASEQARRGAQILLVSSVANTFLALAADQENLQLAEETLAAQQAAYDLVKRRHELGLLPELELFRAQTPLEVARRDVALYTQRVAQGENALTLLAGTPVPPEWWPGRLDQVTPPRAVTPGLPSDLLLGRPDVLHAEALLKAAYADIGVARAVFFPRISLTTTLGTASDELAGLFQSGAGTWSYVPQVVMPIFDARTWSALKASKVQRELAVTAYERAIQNAFREVADALAARGMADHQFRAQAALVQALAETYRLARTRFDRGIDSYLGVLDAQRSLFAAQQVLVFLRLQQLASEVQLFAALGGGGNDARTAVGAEAPDL